METKSKDQVGSEQEAIFIIRFVVAGGGIHSYWNSQIGKIVEKRKFVQKIFVICVLIV